MDSYKYKGMETVSVVSDGVSTVKPQLGRAVESVPVNNAYTGSPENVEALTAVVLTETVALDTGPETPAAE